MTPDLGEGDTVVVVGASLAGLRAAQALRRAGFRGRVVVVGAEPHAPYDRPPLSKQFLTGSWGDERLALADAPKIASLDAEWLLGWRARMLDLAGAQLVVEPTVGEGGGAGDQRELRYDGLILATGARPRTLGGRSDLAGVFTLRTIDDARALSAHLDRHGARALPAGTPTVDAAGWRPQAVRGPTAQVVVIGAGFIGSEVAASCARRGAAVTIVEALATPLEQVLGPAVGAGCAALHRAHGVDVRTGVGVAEIDGDGKVERVVLDDGTEVACDTVVVGIGVRPETGWLEGSGLVVEDGIVCDENLFAADGIVAAGDVARWPHRLVGAEMRIEHWTNAAEQGTAAAENLLAGRRDADAFAPVPFFWSDQYDVKIQYLGHGSPDDELAVVDGSIEEGRFVALYGRDKKLRAAVAFGRARQLMPYRRLLAEGASFDDALKLASS